MKNTEIQIMEVENRLHVVIPKVYRDFLLSGNKMIFDEGILYDIEEIAERYVTLGFAESAAEWIPIGNDNGDYELVMKSGSNITRFGFMEQDPLVQLPPITFRILQNGMKAGMLFLKIRKTMWTGRHM